MPFRLRHSPQLFRPSADKPNFFETMKALFISYNQAISERIVALLDKNGIRGYTLFPLTYGRGSQTGEPHMGSHAWPSMNATVLAIVDNDKIEGAMTDLRELDSKTQLQGLRAFVWEVSEVM